ncbi:MAG: hypothetical protein Q4G55_09900 [bacterium]|nr:hypothetical protein [bacterium]
MQIKCVCMLAAVLGVGASLAATWTGAAGDGQWTTDANWEGNTPPGAGDDALFTASATLAAPTDFTGTVRVQGEGTHLTFDVAAAAALAVAVDEGATLEKTGAGSLTLHAAPGFHPGRVVVTAGEAVFAGNGDWEAPGAFGPVEVAAGAGARIVESPAAQRHGVLVFAGGRTEGEIKNIWATHTPHANFEAVWAGLDKTVETNRVLTVFSKEKPFALSNGWFPAAWQWKDFYMAWARTLFLMPQDERVRACLYADDFGQVYLDGEEWFEHTQYGPKKAVWTTRTLARGFHALDLFYGEVAGNDGMSIRLAGKVFGGAGPLTRGDAFWKGVAFARLDLAAGATLALEDGQALALAAGEASALNGSVTGGAGAVLAVGSGTLAADAARFAGFNGKIELCTDARAALANLGADTAFTVTGAGTVGTDLAGRLADDFTGTVEIPADATFESAAADPAHAFTGAGTLVAPTLKGTERFAGTVRLAGGAATWGAYARGEGAAAEIALGDGAALMVPRKTFLERAGTPLKPWAETDAGAWALGGRSGAPEWSSGHIAYVNDDGNLVLTDDGGQQRNAALYTGHVFTKTSAFDLSFTWTPTQNRWAGKANQAWAEGFAFFLTATNNAAGYVYDKTTYGQPPDAYGFRCYIYRGNGNALGFAWLVNNASAGLCAADTDYSELGGGLGGITLTRPIAFTVTMRHGVMDVTMRQEGKTWRAAYDFAQCFTGNGLTEANAPRLIGLSGGTGNWGDPKEGKAVPYAEQTFSDFAGFVWGEHEDKDPAAHAPSAETWRLGGDAWLTADPGLLFSTNINQQGYAVLRTGVDANRPFEVSFTERLDANLTGNWAEGLGVVLTPDPDKLNNGAAGRFFPKMDRCVAFGHYFWENKLVWSHNGSAHGLDAAASDVHRIHCSLNHPVTYSLVFNGEDTFTVRAVCSCGAVYETARTYPDVAEWNAPVYVAFLGAASTWGPATTTRVTDIAVKEMDAARAFPQRLSVDAGAAATVNLDVPGTNVAAFASVALGADASLALRAGRPSSCFLSPLVLAGAGAVDAAGGAVAAFGEVTLGDAPLVVSGAWSARDEAITFRVDAARLKGGRVLAQLPRATHAGAAEPAFAVTGLDGAPLSAAWRVSRAGDAVRLVPAGSAIILR